MRHANPGPCGMQGISLLNRSAHNLPCPSRSHTSCSCPRLGVETGSLGSGERIQTPSLLMIILVCLWEPELREASGVGMGATSGPGSRGKENWGLLPTPISWPQFPWRGEHSGGQSHCSLRGGKHVVHMPDGHAQPRPVSGSLTWKKPSSSHAPHRSAPGAQPPTCRPCGPSCQGAAPSLTALPCSCPCTFAHTGSAAREVPPALVLPAVPV